MAGTIEMPCGQEPLGVTEEVVVQAVILAFCIKPWINPRPDLLPSVSTYYH
ncbi:hypothetical protein KY285_029786 [Solanum tuberosum]|nr:hypothetical protein KY289_029953 [Solanum tuberosum]KAH0654904.1 hypothetical protein KY285_029786 [Solanum tuberosum]